MSWLVPSNVVLDNAATTLGHQIRVWRNTLQRIELDACAKKMGLDADVLMRIEEGDAAVPIEDWLKCWYAMNTLEDVIESAVDKAKVLGATGKCLFGALDKPLNEKSEQ